MLFRCNETTIICLLVAIKEIIKCFGEMLDTYITRLLCFVSLIWYFFLVFSVQLKLVIYLFIRLDSFDWIERFYTWTFFHLSMFSWMLCYLFRLVHFLRPLQRIRLAAIDLKSRNFWIWLCKLICDTLHEQYSKPVSMWFNWNV